MKVDFYRHQLSAADAERMAAVLASPFLTTGPVCRAVEAQLRSYFAVPHAVLVNSWTNGALAVLLAMGVGPGDEVIVPAMTFIASANVVELTGATVVFADVDPATLLLTPEIVADLITDRTKAVMPVHLYGQLCDVAGLRHMLDGHPACSQRVYILEDAAHCFEGTLAGARPGAAGDAAVFSFYATKNVTCGEGGAVIARDEKLYESLLQSRLHGMSAMAVDRFAGGRYNAWDMIRLGTKANLPDLLAALLPPQIESIDARLPARQELAGRYRRAFAGGPLRLVEPVAGCSSAEHIFPIGVPGGLRDPAIAALNLAGVDVTVNYRDVPGTAYYRRRYPQATDRCPVARRWGLDTLTLPLFPGLTPQEQEHVIESVRNAVYPMVATEDSRGRLGAGRRAQG